MGGYVEPAGHIPQSDLMHYRHDEHNSDGRTNKEKGHQQPG
jgi:hypothetical protein